MKKLLHVACGMVRQRRAPNVNFGCRCRKVNWNCCFVITAGEVVMGMGMDPRAEVWVYKLGTRELESGSSYRSHG